MKTCKKCNETKEYSEYSKCARAKDGYNSWCKACHVEYSARPDQQARRDKWNDDNREHVNAVALAYYEKHRDEINAKKKIWYQENKEHKKAYSKRKYQEQKAKAAEEQS